MVKKLLFILLIGFSSLVLSQESSLNGLSAKPNPFKETTAIRFTSSVSQNSILVVKNVLGKTVYRRIFWAKKGSNSVIFERNDLASGIYTYAIQNDRDFISKRFVIQ